MKIIRSTKCNLKYLTKEKRQQLENIRQEHSKVVNLFIDLFWINPVKSKMDLKKDIFNLVKDQTWFSQRMISNASREAFDMILSSKRKSEELNELEVKPVHTGQRMVLSSSICIFQDPKNTTEFDNWLRVYCVGNKIDLYIPIRKHRHFNMLSRLGKLCSTIQILKNHIQFSFEIETGPKQAPDICVGIDTGIKSLATLSTGEKFGQNIENIIQKIKRRKHGSKGQQRSRAELKDYISKTAKDVVNQGSLIVVEKLDGISSKTKKTRRLTKSLRYFIGTWNYNLWMKRLEYACELNRVSFRRINPYNTSITCSQCDHIDKRNRTNQETFLCRSCGHTGDADINAANNILERFLTGKYGSGCKAKLYKEL